jgi:hypothetical protein
MSAAATAPNPTTQPTQAGTDKPSRAGGLLGLVHKLVSYGTFLAATLRQRGLGNHPDIQGRQFGTTNITLILARIARGLLRAAALEARLHRSAARLDAPRRSRIGAPSAATEAASAPSAPRRRASPRYGDDDTLLALMPTLEEIAAEDRRRPIGEVFADIVRDLGMIPAHPLWRELAQAILFERGRYAALVIETTKRPRRMPIPEHWPEEPPPYLWAAWSYSPASSGTGPP